MRLLTLLSRPLLYGDSHRTAVDTVTAIEGAVCPSYRAVWTHATATAHPSSARAYHSTLPTPPPRVPQLFALGEYIGFTPARDGVQRGAQSTRSHFLAAETLVKGVNAARPST